MGSIEITVDFNAPYMSLDSLVAADEYFRATGGDCGVEYAFVTGPVRKEEPTGGSGIGWRNKTSLTDGQH